MTKRVREVVTLNKCQCRKCGDIIESTHSHDFKWCKCGSIAVDGGKSYLRRVGDLENIIEISESHSEEYEADW
jgi:tRNA(Ile2) C34 agmatinyltransferase TiaS